MKEEKEEMKKHELPEEKVEDLIKDIKDIGFDVEKTKEGEIRISK